MPPSKEEVNSKETMHSSYQLIHPTSPHDELPQRWLKKIISSINSNGNIFDRKKAGSSII